MIRKLSRRRFLAISASAALAPGAAQPATASWRGAALGATASITLGGTGRAAAAQTFAAIEAELSRLEEIFSLYRPQSAISRLNRFGQIDEPPAEFLFVLGLCDDLNNATGGAFDPTVQAVWRAMATAGATGSRTVRAQIGWQGVEHSADRIAFNRPGMAITLNGIAQGYITDRVATLLRTRGYRNVMIDMGEIAAVGRNHGAPWSVEVANPDGQALDRLILTDRCLAVSSPLGTRLAGHAHILDPRPDALAPPRDLAAVSADTAAVADGLSTACCLLSDRDARRAVARFPDAKLETLI